jgi:hypothetical protein
MVLLTSPALADIQFHARPMTNAKIPHDKARCDIHLMVDQQVEVSLHGDMIGVHTLTGHDARDDGSECSAPLPDKVVDGFTMEVKKRRGEVKLVSEPSARNNFTATVFIHDNTAGEGQYYLRISWNVPSSPAGDINRNNAIHSAARGQGKAALNEAAPVTIGDVTVDIDRAGKILVKFQIGRSGSATFTGTVMSVEGETMKVDSAADERFLHLPGPMYLYFDASKQVYKIAMDATNGRDQLRVSWERK